MNFKNKWIEYINNNKIDLNEVIYKYSDSIVAYIKNGMVDKNIVADDAKYLQTKINEKNYGYHKDGHSQLVKLINGWLLEDIFRIMLQPLNCQINGSDVDRKVNTTPTNDPDLKLEINNEEILVEVTNLNKVGFQKFDDSFTKDSNQFLKIRWWQGRSNKYKNLLELVKCGKNIFLINASDHLKSIFIKKIVSSNNVIVPKNKWAPYIGSALSLDEEYFLFKTCGLSIQQISEKIIEIIKDLNKKY